MTSTTPDRVTPRTARPRRDEVRTRILAAATRVVAERGLAGASLDQVAAAAGFTKGAVYSNFAGKDDLFLALLDDQVTRRVATVEAAIRKAPDLPAALAAVGAELGHPDPDGQLLLVEFWSRAVRDPQVRPAFVAFRRDLRARVADVAARFLAEQPVGAGWDPESLAVVVTALANGLAFEALPDPDAVPAGLVTRALAALASPRLDTP